MSHVLAEAADSERGELGMGDDTQLEKRVRDLQHQNMWVIVFMADQDSFAGSAHAMFHIMLFQSLQTCEYRGILFGLMLFGAESVVAEGEEANGGRLVCVE